MKELIADVRALYAIHNEPSLRAAADALERAEALAEALDEARRFIEREYRDPSAEVNGEWLASEARPVHGVICNALSAWSAR